MRGLNNSVETVNAAAAAIVTAESRVQQVTSPRRRWGSCFRIDWCFGFQKHDKRISHAVFVPEPSLPRPDSLTPQNPIHPPAPVLPFIVPPSSPASFLSEPTSAALSPSAPLSFTTVSTDVYSPGGPASIFAIGPYANETQLVSPPVFSTFTTEPSTAPLTPPPEPVHLTTPSSPEVPFARLLTSSLDRNPRKGDPCDFQSYLLYPGSPIGHLISPSSVCSGTSSPFPDREIHSSRDISFISFPTCEPQMTSSAEGLPTCDLVKEQSSMHGGSPLDGQTFAAAFAGGSNNKCRGGETIIDHRVSFELTVEDVTRRLAKETSVPARHASNSLLDATTSTTRADQCPENVPNPDVCCVDVNYHDLPDKLHHSTSYGMSKEFKFDNVDESSTGAIVESDWWVNEKAVDDESGQHKNWKFFSMSQSGTG